MKRHVSIQFLYQIMFFLVISNSLGFLSSLLISEKPAFTNNGNADEENYGLANPYFLKSRDYESYENFLTDRVKINHKYESFTGWRSPKLVSTSINTNVEGIRSTPSEESLHKDKHVWMLGGSTMWGWGVSDHQTIPSFYQSIT